MTDYITPETYERLRHTTGATARVWAYLRMLAADKDTVRVTHADIERAGAAYGSTVRLALRRLEDAGLVRAEVIPGAAGGAHMYTLL